MPIVLIRKLRLSWWQSWNWHKRSLDTNHSALVARLIKLLTWGNENLWTNILLRGVVFINDNYWYCPSQSFCCHQDPEEVELITCVELFFSIKVRCCYCSAMSNSLQPHGPQHARLLVLHYLLEFAQTHVHWVSDAIQTSHPLLPSSPLPSIFPSIRVFSNESALHIRWPKYWSFSLSPSTSKEYSELIFLSNEWPNTWWVGSDLVKNML